MSNIEPQKCYRYFVLLLATNSGSTSSVRYSAVLLFWGSRSLAAKQLAPKPRIRVKEIVKHLIINNLYDF
jgi:hypothetical protein